MCIAVNVYIYLREHVYGLFILFLMKHTSICDKKKRQQHLTNDEFIFREIHIVSKVNTDDNYRHNGSVCH